MSRRALWIIGLLLGLAGLGACWSGVAMAWDGAYQFALTVIRQEPYSYASRFHSWIIWQPTVWASRVTGNLRFLEILFGLPFCFAPAVGFAASCWVAHRHAPHILLWVALGIGFGALPGQVFMINDSIFQMHLFWPVLLAGLCPLKLWKRCLIGSLGIWQLSHPIGIGLCALAAAVSVDSSIRQRRARAEFLGYAVWCAALSAGGMAKLSVFPDPYAAHEVSVILVAYYFWGGVVGWPLAAIVCVWSAAWLSFRLGASRPDDSRPAQGASLALVATAFVFLVVWALDPHSWWKALDYRRWLAPLSLPFFALSLWECRHRPWISPQAASFRGIMGGAVAAMFAVVLGIQCFSWARMRDRLAAQIQAEPSPILTPDSLAWTKETPLDHWSTSALVITLQGRQPHTLELDRRQLADLASKTGWNLVPLVASHRVLAEPGPAGCFEFRPVLKSVHRFLEGTYDPAEAALGRRMGENPDLFR